jgi:hypothetical protein
MVGIPRVERPEPVTVVAHEPGIVVPLLDIVCGKIETVGHVLPVRDESRHIIVHGQVGIPIYLASDVAQVPTPIVMGVAEVGEAERLGGGDNEEISHSRVFIHVPVGGTRKEHPIVPLRPCIVVLLGRVGKYEPCGSVGVDVEYRDEGVLRGPVIDSNALPALEDGFLPPIQPHPGFDGVFLVLLGIGGNPVGPQAGQQSRRQSREEPLSPHGTSPFKRILPPSERAGPMPGVLQEKPLQIQVYRPPGFKGPS